MENITLTVVVVEVFILNLGAVKTTTKQMENEA